MGTVIETDGDFSSLPYGLLPPVRGAVLWSYFGADLASSLKNEAIPDQPLTAVGSPEIHANFARVGDGPTNCFQSQVEDTDNLTAFVVARAPGETANIRMIANSGFANLPAGYLIFTLQGANMGVGWVWEDTSATSYTQALADLSQWQLYAWRWTSGVGPALFNLTTGNYVVRPEGTGVTPVRSTGAGQFRIGSNHKQSSSAAGGQSDIAFVALSPLALSDGEIVLAGNAIRSRLAARGITI